MKIGIMQPYFFPYLGYWQLMCAVDKYVVYDDVNFIKGGRINRNNILINGKAQQINLILREPSPNKMINEISVNTDDRIKKKLIKTIEMAYHKAPFFDDAMGCVESVIMQAEQSLPQYLYNSFLILGEYLGINTEIIMSSSLSKNNSLKGYKKVISICELLEGDEYYNSLTGVPLYSPYRNEFEAAGIELSFPVMNEVIYKQFKDDEFIPNLSIIDVMMFNSQLECKQLLKEYHLIKGGEQ